MFVIQMAGMENFITNDVIHRKFGDTLRYAAEQRAHILAYECVVTPESLEITKTVPIELIYSDCKL